MFQVKKLEVCLSRYLPLFPIEEKQVHLPVMKCLKCGSDVVLKTQPNNTGYYLSCLSFPACKTSMWFPPNVLKLKVQTASCNIVSIQYYCSQWKCNEQDNYSNNDDNNKIGADTVSNLWGDFRVYSFADRSLCELAEVLVIVK